MSEAATLVAPRRIAASGSRARTLESGRVAVWTAAATVALLPLLVPAGPANIAPVDALIALTLATCCLWASTARHRWKFPYGLAMVPFLAGGALGALAGPVAGAGAVALVQDVMLLAWCWAIVNVASTAPRLRILLSAWAYSAVVWVLLLVAGLATNSSALTGRTAREGSRTALTFVDPNVSANYYVLSIMIIWATGRPRHRLFRVAAYGLLLVAIASSGSNSGAVSLIVATVVAGVVSVYRKGGAAPAIAALAAIVLAGYLVATNVSMKAIQERAHNSRFAFVRDGLGRGDVSASQRDMLLHESIPLYLNGGPFGQGPVSTKPRLTDDLAPFVKEAHDDYLAALVERGAVGFVGIFLLVCALLVRAKSVAWSRLRPEYASVVARPHALAGAVAGTLVAGTVYELLHVRHVWTLFAFLAAIYTWGRE